MLEHLEKLGGILHLDINRIDLTFESNGQTIEVGRGKSFRLLSVEGIESSENELFTIPNIMGDGSSLTNTKIKGRPIMVEAEYTGENKQLERKKLMSFFNVHKVGTFTVNYGGRELKIKYTTQSFKSKLENVNNPLSFLVDLYCPNPYWQSIEPIRTDMAVFVGKFEFPLEIKADEGVLFGEQGEEIIITNNSDAEAPVNIEFNGPALNPKVTNLTTGEYILVDWEIAEEEKLVINTDIESIKVEIHNEQGYVEDAFHWIDLGSTFWQLKVGDNKIKYEADIGMDTAVVKIEHREKYLGV